MRILIAASNRVIIGGIEKQLQVMIPALMQAGHEVGILYEHASGSGQPTVDEEAARLPMWYWEDLQARPSAWKDIARWKPDVVYSQGPESLDLERTLLDQYPVVLYAHVYLGTCASGQKCHAFPQPRPCQREFGPMCLALYYPRRCGGLHPVTAGQAYQSQRRRRSQLADHRAILVASRHMFGEFEKHGIDREKLHLVPLPVPESRLQGLPFTPKTPDGRVLFMGRLTHLKGVDHLIQAIPLASRALGRTLTLTIAGIGPDAFRLESLARKLAVPVSMTGWLNAEQKLKIMRQSDVLAVPSLWPEPFGLVGLEAGCASLPAAAYAVGGIPDWLVSGETGELAPADPPTPQGLGDAMVRTLADPQHHAHLCHGAWQMSQRFTMEKHVRQVERILQSVRGTPAENEEPRPEAAMTRDAHDAASPKHI